VMAGLWALGAYLQGRLSGKAMLLIDVAGAASAYVALQMMR